MSFMLEVAAYNNKFTSSTILKNLNQDSRLEIKGLDGIEILFFILIYFQDMIQNDFSS